jgi:hypothetical protein
LIAVEIERQLAAVRALLRRRGGCQGGDEQG